MYDQRQKNLKNEYLKQMSVTMFSCMINADPIIQESCLSYDKLQLSRMKIFTRL